MIETNETNDEKSEAAAPDETPAAPVPVNKAPGEDAPPTAAPADPADCARELKARFPALFTGPAKPLKLRIQADIQAQAPGVFTKTALSAFFRRYTGSHAYLVALTQAKQRYGLDGEPAGEISAEHREAAAQELARRRANHQARRELEDQQRRNRATLLHDFERTTLTAANFCALKGVPVDELDGLLARARDEAAEDARAMRAAPPRRDERFNRPRSARPAR